LFAIFKVKKKKLYGPVSASFANCRVNPMLQEMLDCQESPMHVNCKKKKSYKIDGSFHASARYACIKCFLHTSPLAVCEMVIALTLSLLQINAMKSGCSASSGASWLFTKIPQFYACRVWGFFLETCLSCKPGGATQDLVHARPAPQFFRLHVQNFAKLQGFRKKRATCASLCKALQSLPFPLPQAPRGTPR
jgi:hypothetical protein